jgi:hypothetical protein
MFFPVSNITYFMFMSICRLFIDSHSQEPIFLFLYVVFVRIFQIHSVYGFMLLNAFAFFLIPPLPPLNTAKICITNRKPSLLCSTIHSLGIST